VFTRIAQYGIAAVALLAAGSLVGCASSSASSPGVTLACQSSGAAYQQPFPVGVADVRDGGETDVVVTCRTEPSAEAGSSAKAASAGGTAAAAAPAVTQVLHVRMLWQQGYRVKAAMREVSQNATFHWYVYPAGRSDAAGDGTPQVVEYTGTGLVEMSRDGGQVTLRVAEAKMTPTTVSPGMADPVGPATLSGTLVARTDRRETLALLDDLRATGAAARTAAGAGLPVGAEAKLPLGQ
jgi:hypothetical protein